MIVRVWRTEMEPGREAELAQFVSEHSTPMFKKQPGCLGVFYSQSGASATTISLWQDQASIE